MGIKQILAGAGHPRTNGKLERFHGEFQRKNERFRRIDEFIWRYNHGRPHDSPDRARRRRLPERSRGRCPKMGKQSKTSALGGVSCWLGCEMIAGSRNDIY